MITILFYMTVKAGREQECAAVAKDVTATTKAQDQGCINYAFYRELTTRESWFSTSSGRTSMRSTLTLGVFGKCSGRRTIRSRTLRRITGVGSPRPSSLCSRRPTPFAMTLLTRHGG